MCRQILSRRFATSECRACISFSQEVAKLTNPVAMNPKLNQRVVDDILTCFVDHNQQSESLTGLSSDKVTCVS